MLIYVSIVYNLYTIEIYLPIFFILYNCTTINYFMIQKKKKLLWVKGCVLIMPNKRRWPWTKTSRIWKKRRGNKRLSRGISATLNAFKLGFAQIRPISGRNSVRVLRKKKCDSPRYCHR